MRWWAGSVIVATVLASASSGAGTRDLVEQAKDALRTGDLDRALVLIDQALNADPHDAEAHLARGNILFDRREYEAARAEFKTYLASGPSASNHRTVEEIIANIDHIANTFLRVAVRNGPAQVYLDVKTNRPFCITNPECTKGVIPGHHQIIIERAGFKRVQQDVVVNARSTTTIETTLVAAMSPLRLQLEPADAIATVDGKPFARGAELAPGGHVVAVSHRDYLSHTQRVTANPGKPIDLVISLHRTVPITVEPADATLDVNGVAADRVDGRLVLPLGSGPHTVVARARGFSEVTAVVPVAPPADYELRMVLHRPRAHLVVANARPGAQVLIDGAVRGAVSSGGAIDVPTGHHKVEIDTPGFLPFRAEADFAPEQVSTVRIEDLRQVDHRNAWIAASVAGAAVVSGSILGALALSRSSEFPDHAAARGVTHDNVQTLARGGRRFAVASDISFGVGLAALSAALYLWRSEGHAVSSGHIELGASSVSWRQSF